MPLYTVTLKALYVITDVEAEDADDAKGFVIDTPFGEFETSLTDFDIEVKEKETEK